MPGKFWQGFHQKLISRELESFSPSAYQFRCGKPIAKACRSMRGIQIVWWVRIPLPPPACPGLRILRMCSRALSPAPAAVFPFNSRMPSRQRALVILQRAIYLRSSALRASSTVPKFQRFEGSMNFDYERFCGSSRTREKIHPRMSVLEVPAAVGSFSVMLFRDFVLIKAERLTCLVRLQRASSLW
jgi:hypothetical protein